MTRGDNQRMVLGKLRRVIIGVAALVTVGALSGCGAVALTTPDQVSLRYSGSDITYEAEKFVQCYGPSEYDRGGWGDKVYTYPAGQRTFKFSQDPGADSPPLTITAKGGAQLTVSGTITFTPQFQDCNVLKDFHERIGRKYGAFVKGEDDETTLVIESLAGWNTMLGTYVKDPAERAIDNASLAFTPEQLTSDPASKAAWEAAALTGIPTVMKSQSGGEFFKIDSVLLQAPQQPPAIQEGILAKDGARLRGEAAEIDKQAAATWPGGPEAYAAYQQGQAVNQAIREGKVQVIPIPQGSPVQVAVPVAPR